MQTDHKGTPWWLLGTGKPCECVFNLRVDIWAYCIPHPIFTTKQATKYNALTQVCRSCGWHSDQATRCDSVTVWLWTNRYKVDGAKRVVRINMQGTVGRLGLASAGQGRSHNTVDDEKLYRRVTDHKDDNVGPRQDDNINTVQYTGTRLGVPSTI